MSRSRRKHMSLHDHARDRRENVTRTRQILELGREHESLTRCQPSGTAREHYAGYLADVGPDPATLAQIAAEQAALDADLAAGRVADRLGTPPPSHHIARGTGPGEGVGTELYGENATRMNQLLTAIKIEAKNIAELGALSGPDNELMEQLAGVDTTSFGANLKALFGSDNTDDWVGKEIVLFTDDNVTFGGELVGGLRFKAQEKFVEIIHQLDPKQFGIADQLQEASVLLLLRPLMVDLLCASGMSEDDARDELPKI